MKDFSELDIETHFEKSISFIVNDRLKMSKVHVHFNNKMEESTRCSNYTVCISKLFVGKDMKLLTYQDWKTSFQTGRPFLHRQ